MTTLISFTWEYLNNPKTTFKVVAECYARNGEYHALINEVQPLTLMAHVSKLADPYFIERCEQEAIRQYQIHLTDAVMHKALQDG